MLLLALLAPSIAGAHSRGTSYSDWTIDAHGASVHARVSQLELTRLQLLPESPDYAARVAETLRANLQLWSETGQCTPGAVSATAGEDGWVAAHWSMRCADQRQFTIRSSLFQSVAPSHLHFARVTLPGAEPFERVLTFSEPFVNVDGPPDASGSFLRYLKLGIEHILSGWDHMAFVLALILLAPRLREVALVATGFTIAHSLTLAAAVLGWASVQSGAVEALIGFSIAMVAAENLWQRAGREWWLPAVLVGMLVVAAMFGAQGAPYIGVALFTACYFGLAGTMRLRIGVAFIFGLVHGFGFAGAMTSLHLPDDRLVIGLLGFNSGVELGQLLVIALVWPALKLLERAQSARRWVGDLASACICGLGVFWFVTRAFAIGG